MEEMQAAMTAHLDQISGLVQALSSELRRGMGPAADNLRAFVRAVDWTQDVYDWKFGTWFLDLPFFYLAHDLPAADSGVYMAEKINRYLGEHWRSFAGQNYFDRPGVFISVVWSGPLIFISIVSVVSKNMLALMLSFCLLCRNAYLQFSLWCLYDYASTLLPFQVSSLIALCRLMVKWKRAELRHRARLARDKQE
ncbi:hypothetical protein HU200_002681 [Digitaria exilis]|uniref:Transmembrane protein 18 n=1 Tax=Digitaria exilis TaxID=1010633 RepID=A0A835KWL2_9POAL|nr:hypothetical protein HU200_002681 [Digitaria exilis]